ncbi:outer membrane protein transport protein [Psychrobacter sp. I-STPA6b]|uniref:outer membrane protein transport protein n=1 Tax=Psychrobacter sp. I-STPA6b TaxID=2585718 RepID=UPI001D0C7192|nr:outer membrane protein transport protein [Psychrobacter sp. I-STPA6b]
MTSPIFSLKTLAVAITSISVAGVASAAGLDRSGQDVSAFLQDGTYAEASYTYIDADVTGHDNAYLGIGDLKKYDKGNKIGDIAEPYDFFRYGVKTDINDTFSVGVLYDEPFGAAAAYSGKNNFVSGDINDANALVNQLTGGKITSAAQLPTAIRSTVVGAQQAAAAAKTAAEGAAAAQQAGNAAQAGELAKKAQEYKAKAEELQQQAKGLISAGAISGGIISSAGEGTNVEVRTHNITGLLGVKLGADKNLQVYGGPAFQRLEADVKLRGPAYLTSAGYDAHVSPNEAVGWVAGVAYSKPEIGLKAALTYRSEIDHTANIAENLPSVAYLPDSYQDSIAKNAEKNGLGSIDITTPESFNLDFQTGLNPTTLATAKVRYVPWSKFEIVPPLYNAASKVQLHNDEGLPLVGYDKDQWQVEVGIGKRLTPALAVSGTVGWDSGAGNPVTSLGPIEGYYSVGAGAKYNITPNWAISAGGKYLMFGDAKGKLPNDKVVSNFEDNNGYAVGVKLSYQDK